MSPEQILSAQTPWPGLRSFAEHDRAFFFGRQKEAADLYALVQRSPVVVLYGQSGLGKTSLLQAGLFPALREGAFLPFIVRLDHGENAPALADQIKAALTATLDGQGLPDGGRVEGPRPAPDETLWEYFHRRDLDLWGPRNRLLQPVVVLDQFEETFTLGQRSIAAAKRVQQFVRDLEALLEHRAPEHVRQRFERNPDEALKYDLRREAVKLVITLREDFLAQLDTWRVQIPSLLPSRFRLERMTGAQALEVVQHGGKDLVDAGVASDIVDFVSRSRRRASAAVLEQRNVEPALLSVVCDELNRRRLDKKEAKITARLQTVEREGIIQAFYERAFSDIDPRVRDWIEDHLLTSSGYRDRAALEDALKESLPESAFTLLVDRRILHREERDGVVWLELTHDLLTDPATVSRTQREQRQQAEEAQKREREISEKLKRSRQVAAVFAVLFAGTVVALVVAYRMWNSASVAKDETKAALTVADELRVKADNEAKRVEVERARADVNQDTTLGIADAQANLLIDSVRDMRIRTPTVLKFIQITDESFRTLISRGSPKETEVASYASFLIRASEALYHVGHISDGLDHAERAVALLDGNNARETPGLRGLYAGALNARGEGLLATNKLPEARTAYTTALEQTAAVIKDGHARESEFDLRRVQSQAELGLGEIDARQLNVPSATKHFQRVLDMTKGATDTDSRAWRVMANRWIGQIQTEDDKADTWFRRAQTELDGLTQGDPTSLRGARLSAELNYLRGRTANFTGRPWDAVEYFEKARVSSDQLTAYDPDNLEWKLGSIRASRGSSERLQLVDTKAAAVDTLTDSARVAADLVRVEGDWRAARFAQATVLYDLGEIHRRDNEPEKALAAMEQAQRMFTGINGRSSGDLEAQRGLALATFGVGRIHFEENHVDDAVRFFRQSLDALVPAERSRPVNERVLRSKGFYLNFLALAYQNKRDLKSADTAFVQCLDVLNALAKRTRSVDDETTLADALVDYGEMLIEAGRADQAPAQYNLAVAAVNRAIAADPGDAAGPHQGVRVWRAHALLAQRRNEFDTALSQLRNAATAVWRVYGRLPGNETLSNDLTRLREDVRSMKMAADKVLNLDETRAFSQRADQFVAEFDVAKNTGWIMPAMMPGAWRNLTGTQLAGARQMASEAIHAPTITRFTGARALTLEFRPTVPIDPGAPVPGGFDYRQLIEVGFIEGDGSTGIVTLLTTKPVGKQQGITRLQDRQAQDHPTGRSAQEPRAAAASPPYVVLDGSTASVRKMNEVSAPLLTTDAQALAYLRFYLAAWQGQMGPFTPIERIEDVRWDSTPPADVRAAVARELKPIEITKEEKGSWLAHCLVIYDEDLYWVEARVLPSGTVNIVTDKRLVADLPVRMDVIVDGVRRNLATKPFVEYQIKQLKQDLVDDPEDDLALSDLVDAYDRLERWKEAAATQARYIEVLLKIFGKDIDEKDRKELADEYLGLSWHQLLAREFKSVETSAAEGRKYAKPEELHLDTNLAHALLFQNRVQEAEAIYRRHIGKKMDGATGDLWEDVILNDFDILETQGLKSPEIARIRRILKPKVAVSASSHTPAGRPEAAHPWWLRATTFR